jgi:hypothetical protein
LASKSQRWIVAQRIRIVMVAPPLRDQQQAGADQRGEIMRDVDLAQADPAGAPSSKPRCRSVPVSRAQQHRAGVASQPVGAAFDAK